MDEPFGPRWLAGVPGRDRAAARRSGGRDSAMTRWRGWRPVATLGLLAGALGVGAALAAPSAPSGWRPQAVPEHDGRPPVIYTIAAADAQTLWAAGSQGPANVALFAEILKTTDGGRTWRVQYTNQACCQVLGLVVHTPTRVTALQAAAPTGSRVLSSYDGGQSWQTDLSLPASAPLWAIAGTRAGAVWAVGDAGRIIYRDSDASRFSLAASPTAATLFGTAAAPGTAVGWAVGADGVVLKTVDAGRSWALQARVANQRLTAVAAASARVAWAVGAGGQVFKTGNGGESWVRQFPENTASLNAVATGSEDVAWVLTGVDGGVARIAGTTDGGQSWSVQYQDDAVANERLVGGIVATGPYDAWAASTATILRTTTGGPARLSYRLPLVPAGPID
jgi:photosystem II stability/assembly factor-like uncharacterized protein